MIYNYRLSRDDIKKLEPNFKFSPDDIKVIYFSKTKSGKIYKRHVLNFKDNIMFLIDLTDFKKSHFNIYVSSKTRSSLVYGKKKYTSTFETLLHLKLKTFQTFK